MPQRSAAAEDRYRSAACDWSVEMVEERSRGLGAEHALGASSPGPGHITRGTVEERIDAMIADRRQLADSLLDGDREMNLTELSDDELLQLVRPDVTRGATPFCGTRGDTRQSGRYAAPTAAQAPSGHPSAGGQRSRLGVVAAPGTWPLRLRNRYAPVPLAVMCRADQALCEASHNACYVKLGIM